MVRYQVDALTAISRQYHEMELVLIPCLEFYLNGQRYRLPETPDVKRLIVEVSILVGTITRVDVELSTVLKDMHANGITLNQAQQAYLKEVDRDEDAQGTQGAGAGPRPGKLHGV